MTGALIRRGKLDTGRCKGKICEDTGRRWTSISQGERPQEKPTLLTDIYQISDVRYLDVRYLSSRIVRI